MNTCVHVDNGVFVRHAAVPTPVGFPVVAKPAPDYRGAAGALWGTRHCGCFSDDGLRA
ncbi:MAG: hypothetical protein HOQ05_07455 [Corynebacteriales bacterium]|nr:hypothetical protein [Mycobacteriales bacterium]